MRDYFDQLRERLRERMAAEGLTPSAHREALDEIADHLNDLYRTALRDGMNEAQAHAVVEAELSRMGPLAVAAGERARRKSGARSARRGSGFITDVRHAIRSLRTNRGFSAIVILTLAVGIGACTAVFSIVNALLLGSPPYPHPEQLVLVWETEAGNRDRRALRRGPDDQEPVGIDARESRT